MGKRVRGNAVIEAINCITEAERTRLVRLCAHLSGRPDAAEDLAQEALLEAWRSVHKLHDPAGRERWLAAIARNVCLRWTRKSVRAQVSLIADGEEPETPDSLDIEADLDQRELGELLDRALALLPAETRQVLIEHHIDGLSQAEVAAHIQISEDAVSMRLSRGRRALRRLLTTDLRDDATAFGLLDEERAGWRETRVWCASCGQGRLLVRLEPAPGVVSFRCPRCNPEPGVHASDFRLTNQHFARLIGGRRQPWRILRSVGDWSHDYFHRALKRNEAACTHCGTLLPLQRTAQRAVGPHLAEEPVFYVVCPACSEACSTSLTGLASAHPSEQRFWREQGRIRSLPHTTIEHAGRASLVVGYAGVAQKARLDLILAVDNCEVLAVHPPPMTPSA